MSFLSYRTPKTVYVNQLTKSMIGLYSGEKTIVKKPFMVGLVALGIVSVGFATHTAADIFSNSADVVTESSGTLKQGFVHLFVEEGDTITNTVALEVGKEYTIIAVGDEEILSDIDLVVRDSRGNVLKQDSKTNSARAEVTISPTTRFTEIDVTAKEMPDTNGYGSVLIFEQE